MERQKCFHRCAWRYPSAGLPFTTSNCPSERSHHAEAFASNTQVASVSTKLKDTSLTQILSEHSIPQGRQPSHVLALHVGNFGVHRTPRDNHRMQMLSHVDVSEMTERRFDPNARVGRSILLQPGAMTMFPRRSWDWEPHSQVCCKPPVPGQHIIRSQPKMEDFPEGRVVCKRVISAQHLLRIRAFGKQGSVNL